MWCTGAGLACRLHKGDHISRFIYLPTRASKLVLDEILESSTKNGINCNTWNLAEFAKLSIIWLKLIRNNIKNCQIIVVT